MILFDNEVKIKWERDNSTESNMKKNKSQFPASQMSKDENKNKKKLKKRQRTRPELTWVSMSDPRLGRKTEIVL